MKSTHYDMSNINNININSGIPSERFISNVEEFICTICTDVVKNPVYFQCSHMLCMDCYSQLQNKICPSCSEDITEYSSPPFIIKNLYNKLGLKCINFRQGCEYTDILSNIENHEKNCEYNLFICPDCEGSFIFLNKFSHENSCEKREIFVLRKQNEELNMRINEVSEERDLAVRQRDEGADFRLILDNKINLNRQMRDILKMRTQIIVLTLQNTEKDERIQSLETELDISYTYAGCYVAKKRKHKGHHINIVPNNGTDSSSDEIDNNKDVKKIWSCCGNNISITSCFLDAKNLMSSHNGKFTRILYAYGPSSGYEVINFWTCCLNAEYVSECPKQHSGLLQISGNNVQGIKKDIDTLKITTNAEMDWSCCGKKSLINHDTSGIHFLKNACQGYDDYYGILVCSEEKK